MTSSSSSFMEKGEEEASMGEKKKKNDTETKTNVDADDEDHSPTQQQNKQTQKKTIAVFQSGLTKKMQKMNSKLKKLDDLDFSSMTTAQIAAVVRKVPNSKRDDVLRKIKPSIIKPNIVKRFLDKEELMEMRDIFKAIDNDGSESIDFMEITDGFKMMEVEMSQEQILAMAAGLGKGTEDTFDFEEFATLLLRVEIFLKRRTQQTEKKDSLLKSMLGNTILYRSLSKCGRSVSWTRNQLWLLFDDPTSSIVARILSTIILIVILISCLLFMLETTPYFQRSESIQAKLEIFEEISVYLFSVEFLGRFIGCPSFVKFIKSGLNWIDLVAILPFYLERYLISDAGASGSSSLRVVRLVRIFRVLKVGRYLRWIGVFVATIEQSLLPLGMVLFIVVIGLTTLSSLQYYAERGVWNRENAQWYRTVNNETVPSDFQSIPATFWYTMSTFTTVGYGEPHNYPVNSTGKLIGIISALFGILVLAIPISVISSNFKFEYDKLKTRQEIELEQNSRSLENKENVEEEIRKNKHLSKVIRNSEHFAMAASLNADELTEHYLFATAVYKSCRTVGKRVFKEMKHKERENRHLLLENLIAIQQQYIDTREPDMDTAEMIQDKSHMFLLDPEELDSDKDSSTRAPSQTQPSSSFIPVAAPAWTKSPENYTSSKHFSTRLTQHHNHNDRYEDFKTFDEILEHLDDD